MYNYNPVFIPGPTNIPHRIRPAMQIQTIDHLSPGFAESILPILQDVKKVFATENGEVPTFTAGGTGAWIASAAG